MTITTPIRATGHTNVYFPNLRTKSRQELVRRLTHALRPHRHPRRVRAVPAMTAADHLDDLKGQGGAEVTGVWVELEAMPLLPADARMATAARDRDVLTPEMATAAATMTTTRISRYLQYVLRTVRQMHFYE